MLWQGRRTRRRASGRGEGERDPRVERDPRRNASDRAEQGLQVACSAPARPRRASRTPRRTDAAAGRAGLAAAGGEPASAPPGRPHLSSPATRGLVGSACSPARADGFTTLLTATRDQLDLRDQAAVNHWFRANRPEYVFLVAGTVGGIMANSTRPAEFLYDNMLIHATVVHASHVRRRQAPLPRQLVHLPPPGPPADHRGRAPHRPARAHQRGVRARQDHRHQALPVLPRPVRLRLHLGHAHQPLRPGDNFDLGRPPRADADAPLPRGQRGRRAEVEVWGTGSPRASSCTSTTWPTPASS